MSAIFKLSLLLHHSSFLICEQAQAFEFLLARAAEAKASMPSSDEPEQVTSDVLQEQVEKAQSPRMSSAMAPEQSAAGLPMMVELPEEDHDELLAVSNDPAAPVPSAAETAKATAAASSADDVDHGACEEASIESSNPRERGARAIQEDDCAEGIAMDEVPAIVTDLVASPDSQSTPMIIREPSSTPSCRSSPAGLEASVSLETPKDAPPGRTCGANTGGSSTASDTVSTLAPSPAPDKSPASRSDASRSSLTSSIDPVSDRLSQQDSSERSRRSSARFQRTESRGLVSRQGFRRPEVTGSAAAMAAGFKATFNSATRRRSLQEGVVVIAGPAGIYGEDGGSGRRKRSDTKQKDQRRFEIVIENFRRVRDSGGGGGNGSGSGNGSSGSR